jgi:hypothetical protein
MISHREDDFDDDVVSTKQLLVASLAIALILGTWVFLSSLHIS